MFIKKALLWFFALLLAVFLLLASILYWNNFKVDLTGLRSNLSNSMSEALNKTVEIQGPIELSLSLKPDLIIKDIQISSLEDAQKIPPIHEMHLVLDLSNLSVENWWDLLRLNTILPTNISISSDNTTLSADGIVSYQDSQISTRLAVVLKGKNLNDINFFSQQALPDIGPYSLQTDLTQQQMSIELSNIFADIGAFSFTGEFSYNNINQRHSVKAAIDIPSLILPKLSESETQRSDTVIPDAMASLGDIDFSVKIKSASLQYQNNLINDVEVELAFEHGKTKKAQLKSNVNNTPITLALDLDMQELINMAGTSDQAKINATMQLSVASHQISMQGYTYFPFSPMQFDFKTALKGTELVNLSELLQTALPDIDTYLIETTVSGHNQEFRWTDLTGKVDETDFRGDVTLNVKSDRPFVNANIEIDSLLIDKYVPAERQSGENQLFAALHDFNADLNININQLSSQYVAMENVNLSGKIDNSQLAPAKFAFQTGSSRYSGQLAINARKNLPEINLRVAVQDFRLAEIPIIKNNWPGMDIESPNLDLNVNSKGKTIEDLLARALFTLTAPNGKFIQSDKNISKSWPLKETLIKVKSKTVTAATSVTINHTPLRMELGLTRPKALTLPTEPLDLEFNTSGANSKLKLKLVTALPFDWQKQMYFVELEGDTLNSLNPLFGANLPQLGPYTLQAKLNFFSDGLALSDANANIKDSAFDGNFTFRANKGNPIIHTSIRSDYVKLSDILSEDMGPAKTSIAENEKNTTAPDSQPAIEKPFEHQLENIHQNLQAKNIIVDLNLNNVDTGDIKFKNIITKFTTGDGKVELKPLEISYLDGKISSVIYIKRAEEKLKFKLNTQIENLDYGFLSNYIEEKNSTTEGTVSTDIDLISNAPTYDQLLENLNGHFNVIIWPQIVGNYILEVWGEGIFRSTLSAFLPYSDHKFNCIVGYFDIENGLMQSRAFNIDTSRLVIFGSGSINLANKQLDIVVQPQAKQAYILTNEVPMQISGSWKNYTIQPEGGLVKGGIIGSMVRVPKNLITFPYRAMTDIVVPKDSQIDCKSVH